MSQVCGIPLVWLVLPARRVRFGEIHRSYDKMWVRSQIRCSSYLFTDPAYRYSNERQGFFISPWFTCGPFEGYGLRWCSRPEWYRVRWSAFREVLVGSGRSGKIFNESSNLSEGIPPFSGSRPKRKRTFESRGDIGV